MPALWWALVPKNTGPTNIAPTLFLENNKNRLIDLGKCKNCRRNGWGQHENKYKVGVTTNLKLAYNNKKFTHTNPSTIFKVLGNDDSKKVGLEYFRMGLEIEVRPQTKYKQSAKNEIFRGNRFSKWKCKGVKALMYLYQTLNVLSPCRKWGFWKIEWREFCGAHHWVRKIAYRKIGSSLICTPGPLRIFKMTFPGVEGEGGKGERGARSVN